LNASTTSSALIETNFPAAPHDSSAGYVRQAGGSIVDSTCAFAETVTSFLLARRS
jgi:hypothetical protein